MDTLPYSNDQIIDCAMARGLHTDACRDHALVAWIVMWDAPAYPDRFIARLATKAACPYVLVAETLAGVQAQLPPGLERSERQPADPPKVVEIWFAAYVYASLATERRRRRCRALHATYRLE